MTMAKENKKVEGPACACGKADLYEEWLKNENKKKEATDSADSKENEDSISSSDSTVKESY